ncbi:MULTISPECIES: DnaB-like helicase C-terminal domain-containing protein [unclassified Streptomyces]|uniref:replicative DNA helicase n=1 Tax=unclassified Streptomyces TaxID=2593676 RepID=UPI001F365C2F|nr:MULTISPECIES: DnaB-like helicase C-terminal domain-containing protein [unclassified Streptomyces]MCF0086691.1 Replicative DNA helicase [Streptomyces sp. MH192]MCF0098845.1 Replicative DNA helicase [Streptomyces sp. MH191]
MSTSIPAQHHQDAPPTDEGFPNDAGFARTPPQDLAAEQSVLGALLLSGDRSSASYRFFGETLDTGITASEYYWPAHQIIHRTICALAASGEPVDPITVAAELTKRGDLARVGGAAYLHTCTQAVPTPANGARYAEIVRAKAYRRAVIESARSILEYAYSDTGDDDDVRSLVEQKLTDIIAGTPGVSEAPPTVGDLYLDFVADLEAVQEGKMTGLPYGFMDLDALTSGMHPGNVTVVAAQSGMGKSTLALNSAVAAAKTGAPVMFSSLEMSETELMQKIAAAEGKIALHHLTHQGGLTQDGWDTVMRLGPELFQKLPLRVYRPDGASLGDIASAARACARSGGLKLLVVDYLQLIEVEQSRNISREQAVASVSRGLKNLSVQLGCHVIALSQLNDDGLMRESRAIKNDASVVIKVERPDLEEEGSPRSGEVDLFVEKNRFGPTARVTVAAQLHYSRFVDMAQT